MLLRKVQLSSVLGQQFVRFTQKWVLLLFLSNIIEKKKKRRKVQVVWVQLWVVKSLGRVVHNGVYITQG